MVPMATGSQLPQIGTLLPNLFPSEWPTGKWQLLLLLIWSLSNITICSENCSVAAYLSCPWISKWHLIASPQLEFSLCLFADLFVCCIFTNKKNERTKKLITNCQLAADPIFDFFNPNHLSHKLANGSQLTFRNTPANLTSLLRVYPSYYWHDLNTNPSSTACRNFTQFLQ